MTEVDEIFDDKLEREKTLVMDELLDVRSDNLNKTMEDEVNVSDLILKYFEVYRLVQAKQRANAWEIDDQAVRQLHSASIKLPRVRYFPGSRLKRTPQRSSASCSREVSARKSQLNRSREERYDRLRVIKRGGSQTDDHVDGRESTDVGIISNLANHMVENDLTPEALERQLSDMAETMKDDDDRNEQLHALAVQMVREVLVKASEHVREYREREEEENAKLSQGGDMSREDTQLSDMSITRIEMIAKDMVQSVTESVTAMFEAEMAQQQEANVA